MVLDLLTISLIFYVEFNLIVHLFIITGSYIFVIFLFTTNFWSFQNIFISFTILTSYLSKNQESKKKNEKKDKEEIITMNQYVKNKKINRLSTFLTACRKIFCEACVKISTFANKNYVFYLKKICKIFKPKVVQMNWNFYTLFELTKLKRPRNFKKSQPFWSWI